MADSPATTTTDQPPQETSEFKHASLQEAQAVAGYLRSLAAGLEQGTLTLKRDGRTTTLTPQGLLKFSVSAKRHDDHARLSLKLAWQTRDEADLEAARTFEITPGS